MNTFTLFDAASLAQVAYASQLSPGDTGAFLSSSLRDPAMGVNGVTVAQADNFSQKYKVIYQDGPAIDSGFSGTLFQNVTTNEYYLSLRGPNSIPLTEPDWWDANLDNALNGVSRNQVVDMVNLYIRLTATSGSVVNQYRYAANTKSIEVSGTANGLGLITAAAPLNDKSYGKFFRSLIIDRILRQPVPSKPGVC